MKMKHVLMMSILLSIFVDNAYAPTWRERLQAGLSEDQFREVEKLVRTGYIDKENIHDYVRRLASEPPHEDAINRALDSHFGANVRRELHGIKRGFANPTIGIETLEKYFSKLGFVKSAAFLTWRIIIFPIWSLVKISIGELDSSQKPLTLLIGAASAILYLSLIIGRIVSKNIKETKYNYKTGLLRLLFSISALFMLCMIIIHGIVSVIFVILYAVLLLGIHYLIIRWLFYPVFKVISLWIWKGWVPKQ